MNRHAETSLMAVIPFVVAYAGGLTYSPATLAMVAAASLFIILVRAAI